VTIVVRFNSAALNVQAERTNPINPIHGESLLTWLKEKLGPEVHLSDPEPEDWGWYSSVEVDGRIYTLGSSTSEPEDGLREWVLQIDKQRGLKERLLGQAKLSASDPFVANLVKVVSAEPGFREVQVESAA
jgi:hypothetical protein